MSILKVWVEEDCSSCGVCEDICPEVFLLKDIATVKEGVNFDEFEDQIREAVDSCPMEVIKFSES